MQVEEYIQIAKDEFPYLFDEYGFKVADQYQGEGRDLGRYAFGAESEMYHMHMLFSRQQGGGSIYLGLWGAPFENEFAYDKWIEIANLLAYLDRQDVDWSKLDQYTDEERVRPSFRLQSQLFKPHCPKALEMFSSEATMEAWKPGYEEWLDKEYKKRHGD